MERMRPFYKSGDLQFLGKRMRPFPKNEDLQFL